jgi:hypothetical protein
MMDEESRGEALMFAELRCGAVVAVAWWGCLDYLPEFYASSFKQLESRE